MKTAMYLLFFLLMQTLQANVILPSVFSDHMVLQQQDDVKIWGWANPNEEITISASWTQETYKTKTNKHSRWELKIKTPKYGGPYTLSVKGYNEVIINDVMIGEIWLCSGQSNMQMSAEWGIENGEREVAQANSSNIRFFTTPKLSAKTPQDHVPAKWEVCSPESMKHSSAVAYFFAKKLQENFNGIPVGLLISSWGGTPAEIWMPDTIVKNNTVLLNAANQLKANEWGPIKPARAYNAMIHPLVGYTISGVLWYQGESNVGSMVYHKTLTALIQSWRQSWKREFPFYLVQIAPYNYGEDHFFGVEIRNAQRLVSNKVNTTKMVVISDVSPTDDIHPKDKKSVGYRLANLALKNHYKTIDGLVESPNLSKVEFKNTKAILYFDYAEGLHASNKQSLFELAGDDLIFYPAQFRLKNNSAIIFSKQVNTPKYVRFAWGNDTTSNIFNQANLPLSSFSTESQPQ